MYKIINANQKNFERLLSELPKGATIVSFTCSNDASKFIALVQLRDAIIEKARDRANDIVKEEKEAAIVVQKALEAQKEAKEKAAKKAALQKELDAM